MKSALLVLFLSLRVACFTTDISPNLTAVFNSDKNIVRLKWQSTDSKVTSYILQRSGDNFSWTGLYKIEQDEFSKTKIEKFTDKEPSAGKSYYRLKMYTDKNKYEYSAALMVIIEQATKSWVMYPVPVGPLLNLQYTGSAVIPGVITVFIQNMSGKILTRLRCSSLNRLIQVPVDNLGKGLYDLRIIILDEVVWNQRFVK